MSDFSNALDKLAKIRILVSLIPFIPTNSNILMGIAQKKNKLPSFVCV